MNKQQICNLLQEQGIAFEITEHGAVYTMEEMAAIGLPHPEAEAKNLFFRNDKRTGYYLVTVAAHQRLDVKAFQKQQGLRKLSFGSAEELLELLQLTPGSVGPLGLCNDEAHRVELYLDEALKEGHMNIHPNDNTATLWIRTRDVAQLLEKLGCTVHYFTGHL